MLAVYDISILGNFEEHRQELFRRFPPIYGKNCSVVAKRRWLQTEHSLVTCRTLTNVVAVSTKGFTTETLLADKPATVRRAHGTLLVIKLKEGRKGSKATQYDTLYSTMLPVRVAEGRLSLKRFSKE